jgi:diphthamide biosynthesis protein 2
MATTTNDVDNFNAAYDVAETTSWIRRGGYRRVALQLPDEKLGDAATLARALTRSLAAADDAEETVPTAETSGREVFVLADTTFGACCVDEVGAAHRDADAIVHYGRACCSPTSRTPARFVFDQSPMNVDDAASSIRAHAESLVVGKSARPKAVVVIADQEYFWASAALRTRLAPSSGAAGKDLELVVAEAVNVEVEPVRSGGVRSVASSEGHERVGASAFATTSGASREECAYVWLGKEGPAMTHAMLVLSDVCERFGGVAQYNPDVGGSVSTEADGANETARALKRRRFLIAKAKEAQVVGIVAGTLGVAGYQEMISNLRKLIADSGRKSYTIVAGKPNPQKLANFPEIEVFVMVSCELTALIDGRDYLQPVITPYEASIAFSTGKTWMGEVKLDFASVPASETPSDADADADAEPEFSLISGAYRSSARGTHTRDAETTDALTGTELAERASGALSLRQTGRTGAVSVTSGAEYLITRRSYVGLEPGPKRDEETGALADAPLPAARGQSGRAVSYATEHRDRGPSSPPGDRA